MSRWANGSAPTGEYVPHAEYDAGYRDGYRAAQERNKITTAALYAQIEALVKAAADVAVAKPMVIELSVEQASKLLEGMKHESDGSKS